MRSFLPFAALLGVALVLGCQDVGPVGPDGLVPQFDKKGTGDCELPGHNVHCHGDDAGDTVVDPGTLFNSPGIIAVLDGPGVGGTCGGGATNTDDGPFGNVNFNQQRDDSHVHANVLLRDVDPGRYNFFGNQEEMCKTNNPANVDFALRPAHDTFVIVGANRKAKARIGLDFGRITEEMHASGGHNLWLTIRGPFDDGGNPVGAQVVLRSTAVVVVIPVHDLPEGGVH